MMKSAGIVRSLDALGRVMIPREMRRNMRILDGSLLEILVDGSDQIVLRPVRLQCVCCGSRDEDALKQVQGVHLCPACIEEFGGAS